MAERADAAQFVVIGDFARCQLATAGIHIDYDAAYLVAVWPIAVGRDVVLVRPYEAAAVANLEKAATMGQQANANKLLLGIFANKAAAAYKGKNNAAAYENAVKASEYGDNAQVYMIGGIAAYNLKKYDQAVAMLGKAKPSNSISYYLARAYEDMGNSAKACEYYNKIANDANFGAYAKSKISALCK